MKLMLADDESLEREAIQAIVKQSDLSIEIVAEAENGRKAIELADAFHPDIIMMDIKMPGINGLDAIKELRGRHPYTKFVIVSAYDHFQYAQEAMSLGVKYYLLKPAKKGQIIEIIAKVCEEIELEQKERFEELELKEKISRLVPLVENEMTKSFLLDQINNYNRKEVAELLNLSIHRGFSMLISFSGNDAEIDEKIHEQLRNKIKQLSQSLISPFINNQIVLFIFMDEVEDLGASTSVRTYAFSLARKIINYSLNSLNINCTIGIGGDFKSLDEIHLSYQQALLASTKPNSKIPIVHYQDIELTSMQNKEENYPIELEKQLTEAIRLLDEKRAIIIFKNYFKEITEQNININDGKQLLTELFVYIKRIGIEYGLTKNDLPSLSSFDNVKTYEQLYEIAIVKIKQYFLLLEEKKKVRNVPFIEKAKEYTRENFDKEISLEMVADFIQLSPYYVSKIFKEEYGITYKDYLTKLRVEKAKELINKSELSIKEICYQIGYNDPNYFSRVFKKVTGLSPSEYKAIGKEQ